MSSLPLWICDNRFLWKYDRSIFIILFSRVCRLTERSAKWLQQMKERNAKHWLRERTIWERSGFFRACMESCTRLEMWSAVFRESLFNHYFSCNINNLCKQTIVSDFNLFYGIFKKVIYSWVDGKCFWFVSIKNPLAKCINEIIFRESLFTH